jgi:dTDP-4-dehydrorhamnose reductase
VDTLITRVKGGQTEFTVVNDQFGKPTFTEDLAQSVLWMIEYLDKLESGVYHCTNEVHSKLPQAAGISWYTFAGEIFKQAYRCGIIKFQPTITPCTCAEFPRPAVRPQYSALVNTKLPPMGDWKVALKKYIASYQTKMV